MTVGDLDSRTHAAVAAAMNKAPPWLRAAGPALLIRAGSHACGLALPDSDIDLRGVAIAPASSYLGFAHRWSGFDCKAPDCKVSDLRTFMRETSEGQPNALQVLFCDPRDVLICNGVGEELRRRARSFLSQRLVKPFAGYIRSAVAQVQRSTYAERPNNLAAKLPDLAKSTMHAVRLARTLHEVLATGTLQIERPDAADLLPIRLVRDIGVLAAHCAEVERQLTGLPAWVEASPLPEVPDIEMLDELCCALIRHSIEAP